MTGAIQHMMGSGLPALSVSVSPGSANGFSSSSPVTSNSVSGSVSGGTPPYTYSWSFASTDGGITILSPSSASTAFRAALSFGQLKEASAFLTVTDSLAQVATSNEVAIALERS